MTSRKAAAATLMGLAGLAGCLSVGLWSARSTPDAVLARDYGAALAGADRSWTSLPQNIWLSSLEGGAAGDKLVSPGDTITISGKDGRPQRVEVTELEQIDGDRLGVPGVRFQLVTGRNIGGSGGLVRFIFASQPPALAPVAVQGTNTL